MADLLYGPVVHMRQATSDACKLALISATRANESSPPLCLDMQGRRVAAERLDDFAGCHVWRHSLTLPASTEACYEIAGRRYRLDTVFDRDLRLIYMSCNGQENADDKRELEERDVMWQRLHEVHRQRPFSLILHGGDQLYADDVLFSHPTLKQWASGHVSDASMYRFGAEERQAAERRMWQHYLRLHTQPLARHLLATVPSLMMWDDHDIMDGWGSHDEAWLDSPVGQGVFDVARKGFLLFQRGLSAREVEADLSFCADLPGLRVIAPDLRSERRPERVMGEAGWQALEQALHIGADTPPMRFLMSSVPVLGPRLSLVEKCIGVVPRLRRYEDDLRDQWQSHAHREEWKRLLGLLVTSTDRSHNTALLSGEIHLATRAEMSLGDGQQLHQLVASGIAHPPPSPYYAKALGWFAGLGENPLPPHSIRIRPLPGKRQRYLAERNYLVLERAGDSWSANWHCEDSGVLGPLWLCQSS